MRRRVATARCRPRSRSSRAARAAADRTSRVSQDDLRAILNGLPALVGYWDSDLRNHMANDAYVEYFGVTPEQLRGMHIRDMLGPDLFAKNEPFIRRALAGEPQLFDRAIPTPSGVVRYTQASYVPDVVDGDVRGFFVLVTDITPRREAERALAAAEARFRTLFASAPIGTYLADATGRMIDVNPAGASLLGSTREQLLGKSVLDPTHPEDREISRTQFQRLVAGEIDSYRLEKRYVRADDASIVWAQLDVTALRDQDAGEVVALAQVQDITARRRHEEQLVHLAEHDVLTGLLNRRGVMAHVEREAAAAARYTTGAALLIIDLDGFKEVNDRSGHAAGDRLLVEVADALRTRVRRSDVVGRLGGDEFAIVIPHADLHAAEDLARGLLEVVRAHVDDAGLHVTASIGAARFEQGRTAEEVLRAADLAMYRAKGAGGDRVAVEHAALPRPRCA